MVGSISYSIRGGSCQPQQADSLQGSSEAHLDNMPRVHTISRRALNYVHGGQLCRSICNSVEHFAKSVIFAGGSLISLIRFSSQAVGIEGGSRQKMAVASHEEPTDRTPRNESQLSLIPSSSCEDALCSEAVNQSKEGICALPHWELAHIFSYAMGPVEPVSPKVLSSVCRRWKEVKVSYLPLIKAQASLMFAERMCASVKVRELLQSWGKILPRTIETLNQARMLHEEAEILVDFLFSKFPDTMKAEFGTVQDIMHNFDLFCGFLQLAYDRDLVSLFAYSGPEIDLETSMKSSHSITAAAVIVREFLQQHGPRIINIGRASNDVPLTCIPREIEACTHLTFLDLRMNSLLYIPEELHKCKRLQVVNISENNLTALPDIFDSLPKLWKLQASFNFIRHVPASLAKANALVTLELDRNALESGLQWLAHLERLSILSVDDDVSIQALKNPNGEILRMKRIAELAAHRQRYPLVPKRGKQMI